MSSAKKAAVSFCLHFFFALLIGLPLYAAELVLEPEVGFRGLFQLGSPFPLTVEITNPGRPVEGTLEVEVFKGGGAKGTEAYAFHHRAELSLPAQSKKSVQFTVDPDSISRPLIVNFFSPEGKVSKEIDLRRHFSPSPLVLLLTENNVAPPLSLPSGAPGPLVSISLNHLPSDVRAYRGVSTIIFYEQSLRDLSKAQGTALEAWLSSGGRMLILGSIYYALYQEPSINRFLPVRVTGLKKLSSVPGLERVYGKGLPPLKNLLAQETKSVEGNILIQEGGLPILVEQSRGRGKILYLSLDTGRPPLSRWQGLPLLFKDLLGVPGERGLTLQASWDDSIFFQLLSNPAVLSTYVPVRAFVFWLLIYISGLAFVAWLWQRPVLPRRVVALCFLFLVFFSSFGGYLHFNRGGNIPDGVLLSSTLLESLQDGYVEAQSNVALFSTQRRRYGLQVERGWSELEPIPSHRGTPEDNALVVEEEGRSTRFSFPLREWGYRLFKVRSLGYFPFRAGIETKEGRILLKLANFTSTDLTDCWLVAAGQRFSLGNIAQGSSQIREFSLPSEATSSPDGRPKKMDIREIPFDDKIKETLLRYSFFPEDQGMARWGGGAAFFFGWVKGSPRKVWLDDARIRAYNYTLFRVVLPLEEEGEL